MPPSVVLTFRRNKLVTGQELEALTRANSAALTVPPDLIRSISSEQVFRNALTWGEVWSGRDGRKLSEAVQFTAPAYENGNALLYAQRLWKERGYGWLVRLVADGTQWRVVSKTPVWRSHPAY